MERIDPHQSLIEPQLSGTRDRVFTREESMRPFTFNAEVAEAFDDMASRSIPLYREALWLTTQWAREYFIPGTTIYDIGCSTGTQLELLSRYLPDCDFIGIDKSVPMIDRAQRKLSGRERVRFEAADALRVEYRKSSVIIVNYTLQFLPIRQRTQAVQLWFQALVPGGILIVSDKVRSPEPMVHESMTQFYEEFKELNGYSRTEIERKKEALDKVLVPLSAAEEESLLRETGFAHVETLLRWHQFSTFVAIKRGTA